MIFRRRQDEMEGFRRMREALRQQADPQDHALLDDDQYGLYEDDDEQVGLLEPEGDVVEETDDVVPAIAAAAEPGPELMPDVTSDEPVLAPIPVVVASTPFQRPEGRAATVLGADASWSGTLRSESDVYLEGRVEGTLEVRDTVYVAEQAAVNAKVKARAVVIAGQFGGNIACEGRLEVMPTGRVTGEIEVGSLIVHEGAVIDGTFRMKNPSAGRLGSAEGRLAGCTLTEGAKPVAMRPQSVPDSRGLFPRAEMSEQDIANQESIVDASSAVDGLFRVGHNLRIDGEAKGEIQCEGTLTVAEGARVSAKVVAANVIVAGSLNGEVTCRQRLQILPSGRVSGTVTTASLSIQEGAIYEGELHMLTTPADTRPQPPAARAGGSAGAGRGRTQAANGRAEEAPPPET